jgi:hypothetical protein
VHCVRHRVALFDCCCCYFPALKKKKKNCTCYASHVVATTGVVTEDVSWELFEERFRERYLSEEFIERQLNEFNALRQGGRTVPEYEARFMELLRYAPHLNTEKLKVNKFVFGLNVNIRAKVRILMPQTLHDVVQKALIAEEELISGGQSRTPARPAGQVSSGVHSNIRHQLDIHQDIVASERIHFHYTSMTNASAADSLQSTTTTSTIAATV